MPLGHRERAALGHGHGLPRRRVPDPKEHAPANFAAVKHMASNLLRRVPGKDSLRVKRRLAAWDDDFLASMIKG